MYDIQTFTGRIIELRHSVNRQPRFAEHDPVGERWEAWLTATDGDEHQFVVPTRVLPARVGHAVHLLHVDGVPVGLYNLDLGKRLNFPRAHPAQLFRSLDRGVGVLCAALAFTSHALDWPLTLNAGVVVLLLYFPIIVFGRHAKRKSLQIQVDGVLDEIHADRVVRPFRRSR